MRANPVQSLIYTNRFKSWVSPRKARREAWGIGGMSPNARSAKAILSLLWVWTLLLAMPSQAIAAETKAAVEATILAANTTELEFLPPQLNYTDLCIDKSPKDIAPASPDGALSPAGKLRRARILIEGNAKVLPDTARAAKLLEEVLQKGSATEKASAALYLGKLYANGEGVTQDEAKAEKLWKDALPFIPYAVAFELALMAEHKGDYVLAAQYYQKAAAAGHPRAYLALSSYYRSGKIPSPSNNAPQELLVLAQNLTLQELSAGNCAALPGIAYMFRNNTYGMRNDELAMEWYKAGVSAGDLTSMLMLADGYSTGYRIQFDLDAAEKLWRMAAAQGSAKAMYHLGKTLLKHEDAAVQQEGISFLTQAAKRSMASAIDLLINHYRDAKQVDEAAHWLHYAVETDKATPKHLRYLGEMLISGKGVAADTKKALFYFREASEMGDSAAMVELGKAYKFGRGIKANPVKSYRFFRRAATDGNIAAMTQLYENYKCGIGKSQNLPKAYFWKKNALHESLEDFHHAIYQSSREILKEEIVLLLSSAQKADHYKAILLLSGWVKKEVASQENEGRETDRSPMISLAIANKHGLGLKQDEAVSQRWIALATTPGKGQSSGLISYALALLDETKLGYQPQRAIRLLKQAETLEDDQASYQLGKIYETGISGITASPVKAVMHYEMAAKRGHATAQRRLATLLLASNKKQDALFWFKKAARGGDMTAMVKLAQFALEANDKTEAKHWLKEAQNHHPCTPDARARLAKLDTRIHGEKSMDDILAEAEKGDATAMRKAATYYLYQGDSENAVRWYTKGANQGDSAAMLDLGNAYYTGAGVSHSITLARKWWKKAADAGNAEAAALLQQLH